VGSYIAMSSGRMISSRGRSFTFDHSADGYGRGEGCVSIVMEAQGGGLVNEVRKNCKQTEPYEIMRFISGLMNQDGKSASLTAPSGPSQSAIIKASFREAMITPPEMNFSECHGTGTALGDPIEVGSGRIVNDPYVRETPFIVGATKSGFGHLELGAGIIGVLRVLVTMSMACVTANIHIYQANEHFSLEGFPVHMPTESFLLPNPENNIGGVNSFGFGGTNSRAEFWCAATVNGTKDAMNPKNKIRNQDKSGPRYPKLNYMAHDCPSCLGAMCWTCGVAIPNINSGDKHTCASIREDYNSYDVCSNCYTGDYTYGDALFSRDEGSGPPLRLYIMGSFSQWSEFEEMKNLGDGCYTCAIRLGDTCMEKFKLSTDASLDFTIHPRIDNASQGLAVEGPDDGGMDKNWLIDGHSVGAGEGTVYRISFQWSLTTGRKTISWYPDEETLPNLQVHQKENRHSYEIFGNDRFFKPEKMLVCKDTGDFYTVKCRVPTSGILAFYIVRDQREDQAIYPATTEELSSDRTIPVMGPDGDRHGRVFIFRDTPGSSVHVDISVADGKIAVLCQDAVRGNKTSWESVPREYGLVGSWSHSGNWQEWQSEPMVADESEPGVYRGTFKLGMGGMEQFFIAVGMDINKAIYPQTPNELPGVGGAYGPGQVEEDAAPYWAVFGLPLEEMEVTLDVRARDRRQMVRCQSKREALGDEAA